MTARITFALLSLLIAAAPALAERSHSDGDYVIHYNAIPSTELTAEIASRYGITRSGSRGLINVAVLRQQDGAAMPGAVAATVTASVRSLTGQRNDIVLREVRDQDAIYYIGDFFVRGDDVLRFELSVTPEGAARAIPVRFEQRFAP